MSMPQGWEWLEDLPDEWEAPPDLQTPTPYPEVNLVIRLLSCEFLGFEARAAIGRFVTEEALYDMWFIEKVQTAGWEMKKSALLREVPMEQARIVYEAWKVLNAVSELDAPDAVLLERRVTAIKALTSTLQEAAERLVGIRAENAPAS
ncbi:hypothetical protein ACN27F_23655 [Solwaraspora sp. WMMB335]|uniref:hypothetical protein n=1 Tax=Solwaraspora sp. WMMB335 TaxID=3404118 RepID=UPI003B953325